MHPREQTLQEEEANRLRTKRKQEQRAFSSNDAGKKGSKKNTQYALRFLSLFRLYCQPLGTAALTLNPLRVFLRSDRRRSQPRHFAFPLQGRDNTKDKRHDTRQRKVCTLLACPLVSRTQGASEGKRKTERGKSAREREREKTQTLPPVRRRTCGRGR